MATEREVEEMIARCVDIMGFYHNSGTTAQSKGRMAAEIRAVAARVKDWQPTNGVIRRILDAVKAEMIARYGLGPGVRLDGEFSRAFEGVAMPLPIHSPSMTRR